MDANPHTITDAVALLTDKERECLQRWMHHATAKEIALQLGISHHAVEKRLKSARAKLGVATSLQAARLLAQAEGYGQTVSGAPEVAPAARQGDDGPVGGAANQSPRFRRRPFILGAIAMSLTLIAALALAPLATQTASQARQVEVIDRRSADAPDPANIADMAFGKMDRDSSGFLEEAELAKSLVRTVRVKRGDESRRTERESTPAEADTNGDQRVSRAEYRAWFGGLLQTPAT